MLLIGKMKPERISVGSSEISSAIWNATCWLSATVEINRPVASAPIRNSDSASSSASQLPRIGSPNSTIEARMIRAADASEMKK